MIRIFTDTSANLPIDIINQYHLSVIPFSYSVDGVEVESAENMDFDGKAFYNAMRDGADIKTSMINIEMFSTSFRSALSAGDDVLYIGMSGGISSTAQAAKNAVRELQEEFPERRISAIDTYAASLGEGLLVLEAAEMLEKGSSFDEINEYICDRRKTMCQYFFVDDLHYLRKGGRISGAKALVGSLLKIKPILMGDDEGHIVSCGKARGKRLALSALADYYEKLSADKKSDIGVAHADDEDAANWLIDELKKRGFSGNALTVCYEPVTGSHVGPGTVALFFAGIHK